MFASLLTLPLFLADAATSQVPTRVVASATDEGLPSLQDLWDEALAQVAATSTTTTTIAPPTSPPTTAAAIAPTTRVSPARFVRRAEPVATSTPPSTSPPPSPAPPPPPTSQDGLASWYELEGARAGVCAHRTLPFGTVVTVTAVKTGASMTCVVGDRGPFAASLVIDLFRDDFVTLAPLGTGVIAVHITW